MLRKRFAISLFLSVFVSFNIVHSATFLPSIAASGGERHTLVLTKDRLVSSCGNNEDKQLGLGEGASGPYYTLRQVHGPNDVNFLEHIRDVSAGWMHSLALDSNGNVWAWGDGTYGELGNGLFYGYLPEWTYDGESTPVRALAGQQDANDPNSLLRWIVDISAGRSGQHSLAVDSNHFVFSWGRGWEGQLGDGQYSQNRNKPVQVLDGEMNTDSNFLENIISISAGEQHSMALDADGFVYTWGDNYSGKLGINDYQLNKSEFPVEVHGVNNQGHLENIVAISAGWDHCMALEKIDANDPNCKGRVYTWGYNSSSSYSEGGRLGDGTTNSSAVPVIVHVGRQDPNHPNAPLKNIIAISAGEGHCMALDVNGNLWTWGDNEITASSERAIITILAHPSGFLRLTGTAIICRMTSMTIQIQQIISAMMCR